MVNQPSASVTELSVCSKGLWRGESLSLMKETSVLIESGSSPAARDRLRRLIHISCFAPLEQIKPSAKGRGALSGVGGSPGPWQGARGEGSHGLSCAWAGAQLQEGS